jgi:antimicrobial peptide system SdpA family protein
MPPAFFDALGFVLRLVDSKGGTVSEIVSWRSRTVGLLVALMVGAAGTVAAYAAHVPMPYNPVHLPLEKSFTIASFLPEGWKFFTRDPREESVFVMVRTPEGWMPMEGAANGSLLNALGASRQGRARSVELGQLTSRVAKSEWKDCDRSPVECLDGIASPARIDTASRKPQLCGLHGVVAQKPVPWAWRNSKQPVVMPSRVLLLEVQC